MIKSALHGFIFLMFFYSSAVSTAGEIYVAIQKGDIEQVKNIIEMNSMAVNELPDTAYGNTPLHWALQTGQREIAMLLINKGSNLNNKIYLGVTPLWYAADLGFIDIAELLIEKGADINAETDYGETPFDQALFAKISDPDNDSLSKVIDLLISYGGRPGSKNDEQLYAIRE